MSKRKSSALNKLPWFPFYYQVWMTDIAVRMLSNAERGIYMDMLCFCYSENGLPDDRKILDRVFSCEKEELDLLLTFFESRDGRLHHPKLDAIREDQGAIAKARSKAGKKSAQAKKDQALRAEAEGQQNPTSVEQVLNPVAADPQQNPTITEHNITEHNTTPPTGGLGGESELPLEKADTPPAKPKTPPKKQAKQFVPPSREEFIAHAVEKLPTHNKEWTPDRVRSCANLQFDTYVDQDWHDGNGKKIKSWRTKSINSMIHKKPWSFGSNQQSFADQRADASNPFSPNYQRSC